MVPRRARGRATTSAPPPARRTSGRFEVEVPIAARTRSRRRRRAGEQVTAAARLRVTAPEGVPEDTYFVGDSRRPSLTFAATSSGPATVEVVSLERHAVVRRLEIQARAGRNAVTWDGRTADGFAPAGRYQMRLEGDADGHVLRARRARLPDPRQARSRPDRDERLRRRARAQRTGHVRGLRHADRSRRARAACGRSDTTARAGTTSSSLRRPPASTTSTCT